jgi:hypothetical protein
MQPWGHQVLIVVEFAARPTFVRYAYRSEPLGVVVARALLSLTDTRAAPTRVPAFFAVLDDGRKVHVPIGVPIGPLCDSVFGDSNARGQRPFRVVEIDGVDGGLVDAADAASREIFTALMRSSDALLRRHMKEATPGNAVDDVSDAASLGDTSILRTPAPSPVVCTRILILGPPHESRLDLNASTKFGCALVARVHSSAVSATLPFSAAVEAALSSAGRSYDEYGRSGLKAIVHGVDVEKAGFGGVSLDDLRVAGGCIHPDGWLYVALSRTTEGEGERGGRGVGAISVT